MINLLDINLLIALAWVSHMHHEKAHTWFGRHAGTGWATCPITQSGFVRVSSNPNLIREAPSVKQALSALQALTAHPRHHFLEDSLSFADPNFAHLLIVGHRQVTDAYLLALAAHHGATLVTLDKKMGNLLPKGSSLEKHLVTLE